MTKSVNVYAELERRTDVELLANHKNNLVFSYDFSSKDQLDDWVVEGFGMANIAKGKLILEPEFHKPMLAMQKDGRFSNENLAEEYGDELADLVKEKYPSIVDSMYVNDVFRGGHFNFWNKKQTPDNYSISFDFESLSPEALHMIMFSAKGLNGKDVFSDKLAPRKGLAREIMYGDVGLYRISYFFPFRKTANMRKSPGRHLTTVGPDIAIERCEKECRMVITKWRDEVNYFVDDIHVLSYKDKDPLFSGNWGFRVMVLGKGAYSNINVYELNENPIYQKTVLD
ncbi:hypothetical protein GV64_21685 [Endozoicomonas elysicola]|uniref:Uncharacterized protein n=2 Tax=Endozoicomonas elysicola TaxID=305900 RepID=A0A081KFQ7_9GAMM|nr:hypothetical protein GV64_21685 [Endozoicomonas elysicola]